jgi:hypothetical protein
MRMAEAGRKLKREKSGFAGERKRCIMDVIVGNDDIGGEMKELIPVETIERKII